MKKLALSAILLTATPVFADDLCNSVGNFGMLAMDLRLTGISESAVYNELSEADFADIQPATQVLLLGVISAIYDVELMTGAPDETHIMLAGVAASTVCREMLRKSDSGYVASKEAVIQPAPSAPAYTPSVNHLWIVVASRADQQEAIDLARSYSPQFPSAQVFLAKNGWFAVSVGSAPTDKAPTVIGELLGNQKIPSDSYLLPKQRYHTPIWAAMDTEVAK